MALPSNALLAVLTTFAFLLSGCTTAEPAAAPPSPAAPVGTVSAEGGGTAVGTIRGVVTDEEAMPIQNATIAVKELNLELTTTEAGAFEFLEVPFGKYTLIAAILGYNSATRSVTIDAENPDAETTFSLTALVVREIYHTTFTWQGLMTCGATLVPWCGILDELNQDYGTPNPTNERWLFNWSYNSKIGPESTVFENVWTPTLPETAKKMTLLGLSGTGKSATGPSVLRLEIFGDEFADDLKSNPNYKFRIGVYPDIEPVVNQKFQLHRSDFFGEVAPEGWSYLTEAK